jgi:predicted methyltransferase
MHPQAHAWIAINIGTPATVLEYGSLNINGTVRDCAPEAKWHGVDMVAGPGVDEVADAATYVGGPVDCVVCCEVLEHTPDAEAITRNAWDSLNAGGTYLVTVACNERAPHSAVDGGPIRAGEYYANIDPDAFTTMARTVGFEILATETHRARGDFYLKAAKPHG